ncbi:MAG: hypothetical protein JXA41_15165 [Deltaproteobacteria bacterium]|nr:hypothetical protein [Deltaproteobacteria bacterium]
MGNNLAKILRQEQIIRAVDPELDFSPPSESELVPADEDSFVMQQNLRQMPDEGS